MEEGKMKRKPLSASFVTGAIALVFLIIGYEVAVFIHKAAVTRIEANRDHPDTVYVYVNSGEDATEEETLSSALLRNPVRANAPERASAPLLAVTARGGDVPARYVTLPGFESAPVAFGSDAPHLTGFGHKIICGPGSIKVAHRDNENVLAADLEKAVEQYVKMCRFLQDIDNK